MKKVICIFSFSSIFLTSIVHAQPLISIVNHFDKPLNFVIGINPDVLPDIPANFTLAPKDQVQTHVVSDNKEAYIRVEDDNNDSAFWGIEMSNGEIKFHGYIDKNIAYSWNRDTIVFCTPSEYKRKNSCL